MNCREGARNLLPHLLSLIQYEVYHVMSIQIVYTRVMQGINNVMIDTTLTMKLIDVLLMNNITVGQFPRDS
jgi:hypothetical protein